MELEQIFVSEIDFLEEAREEDFFLIELERIKNEPFPVIRQYT